MSGDEMKMKDWTWLAGWFVCCYSAAALGGLATASSVTAWYPTIAKPEWTPPSWLFGPVWTTLYGMMAVAAFLVWRKVRRSGGRLALGVFVFQLILNVTWSVLFFGMRSPLAGLIDILVLLLAIAVTVVLFFRIDIVAGFLLVPYLLWVCFATALNHAIWRLNPLG